MPTDRVSESAAERYTLDEARRELDRRECAHRGHSWDVISSGFGPVAIVCGRCGISYRVVPRTAEVWYLAECQDCRPVLPQPFRNATDRDEWALAHGSGTGHDVVCRTEVRDV